MIVSRADVTIECGRTRARIIRAVADRVSPIWTARAHRGRTGYRYTSGDRVSLKGAPRKGQAGSVLAPLDTRTGCQPRPILRLDRSAVHPSRRGCGQAGCGRLRPAASETPRTHIGKARQQEAQTGTKLIMTGLEACPHMTFHFQKNPPYMYKVYIYREVFDKTRVRLGGRTFQP